VDGEGLSVESDADGLEGCWGWTAQADQRSQVRGPGPMAP
jgi:hypothetical protein